MILSSWLAGLRRTNSRAPRGHAVPTGPIEYVPIERPKRRFGLRPLKLSPCVEMFESRTLLTTLTIDVTTETDEFDLGNGAANVSLRDAIVMANSATEDEVVINLDIVGQGSETYVLSLTTGGSEPEFGDLDITTSKPVTIRGSGATTITVTPTFDDRILDTGFGTNVTLFDVTLDGDSAIAGPVAADGAGIRNMGDLTIIRSSLIDFSSTGNGGAIDNFGTLDLQGVTISGNSAMLDGGGLYNRGLARIDASTFGIDGTTPNSARNGGAIYNSGTLDLQRSLIRGGVADDGAGGGSGGGLFTSTSGFATVSIDNSTFGENEASDGGAIWVQLGDVSLTSVTITQNAATQANLTGGVAVNAGTVTVQNSVIAGNIDATTPTPNAADVFGNFVSLGNNFIGDADDSTGFSGDTTGSEMGSGVADPELQALADNGGPTLTYAPDPLGTNKPLIDNGNLPPAAFGGVEIPRTDQRGTPRPTDMTVDIGAVESNVDTIFVTAGQESSLRLAVGQAQATGAAVVIPPAIYNLTSGSLQFGAGSTVQVIGFGPLNTVLDAGGNSRLIETISPGLEVSGVTLQNGDTTSETFKNGGAVLNSGMTRLINVHVLNNSAVDGGGIASDGSLELQGVVVGDNSATGDGGGVAIGENSSARIIQSTITDNQATGDSGGIGVDGNVEIHESAIINNIAGMNAGGIGVGEAGFLTLNSSGVDSNSAQLAGGIGTRGETMVVFSSVTNNTAVDGGGIGADGGRLELQAAEIAVNTATGSGGGIYLETLPGSGHSTEALISNTEIAGNHSVDGGGIASVGAFLTIDKSTIAENFADLSGGGSGGGLFVLSGEAILKNSTVASNIAGPTSGNVGGGIYNSGALVSLASVTVFGNSAHTGGGVATGSNGTTTAINTIISANAAGTLERDLSNEPGSTLRSKGHNVFGFPDSRGGFVLEPGASGDQFEVVNPMLGTLDSNGGPTRTMVPQAGSPALDAGDDSVASATDQRGVPRQLTSMGAPGVIDVGAAEAGFAGVIVETTDDTLAGDFVSLRDAIVTANASSTDITIVLPPGEYSIGSVDQPGMDSTTGDFDILNNMGRKVTIIGAGMGLTTVDGAEMDRVFDLAVGADVELRDLSIINGRADGSDGGGIRVDRAHLDLLRVELRDNDAINNVGGGFGGAIYTTAIEFGTVNITDSLVQNNSASLSGGAIYNDSDAVTISGTLLRQNQAGNGGAVTNLSGTVTVTSSHFDSNTATGGAGGAINNDSGVLSVSSSLLTGNSAMGAGGFGGAIHSHFSGAELTIDGSELSANTSTNFGGAVYVEQTATITNSTFETNSASSNGGAIAVEAPLSGSTTLTLTNSTLSGNFATGPGFGGGGLAIGGDTDITVTILNSTITQNSADVGGGIQAASAPESPKVELKNSIVSANQAGLFDNDVNGPFSSMAGVTGNNLIGEIGTATGIMSQSGNVLSPDPKLRPLGDYSSQPSFIFAPEELEAFVGQQMMGAQNVTAGSFEAIEPPIVRTHALLPDSMAIDAGNNTNAPTEDQRGIARPVNATVDIGAVEYAPITVSGLVFSDYNANGVQDMGEPGLQGVTVFVDLDNDGVLDDFGTAGVYEPGFGDEPFLETDVSGAYSISGLPPFEQYTVRQVEPAGFEQTAPFEIGLGLFGMLTDRVETGQIGGIAVGDFNGDSKDDMAVTLEGSGEVVVFLNDANGGFTSTTVGGFFGSQPFSIVAADFDGDFDTDLVVANEGDGTIQLLRNNGSGVFSGTGIDPVDVFAMPAVTGIPVDLAAVELDMDDAVELVLVDDLNGTFVVLNYDPTPLTENLVVSQTADVDTANPLTALPSSLAVTDIDNDGNPDLAVTTEGDNSLRVFLGTGSGTFNTTASATVPTGAEPARLRAEDLDGDEDVDLAVVNQSSGTVTVFLNDSSPGTVDVTNSMTFGTIIGGETLLLEDFNGDGVPDLLTTSEQSPVLALLLNDGSGGFSEPTLFNLMGTEPVEIATIDLNGDGHSDLAITDGNFELQQVMLLANAFGAHSLVAAAGVTLSGNDFANHDIVAPGTPTVDSVTNDTGAGGDGVTSDNTLIINGTAEADSVVEIFIGGSTIGTTTAGGIGNWSIDHTGTTLSDGTYSITARATDASGNTGATSGTLTVTIDTAAPGAPTVASVTTDSGSSSTDGVTNDNTLIISGTAEANSVVEVFIGGSSIGTTMANGSGDWSFDHTGTTLSDNTYSITAKATDAAGNISATSSTLTIVVDTSAPGAPTVASVTDDTGSSSTDGVTSDNTLVFTGTAEANSVVEVFIGGSSIGTTMADGSGDWSLDHTGTTLSDNTYSITAKATDAAGNISATSGTLTVVVDTSAPSAPIVTSITNDTGSSSTDGVTNDNTLIISGTAEANSVVEVFVDGSSIGTATADGSGDWSLDHTGTTLSDDTYSITARATDASGNVSVTSGTLTVVVDTAAPGAPTVASVTNDSGSSSTDGVTNDNTLIISGTAEANSVVEVFIDGSSIGTTMANGSGDWSLDHTGTTLSDDTYSVTAAATDAAGNASATSGALTVVVDTSAPGDPTVVSVTNDTGSSSTDGVTSDSTLIIIGTAEANSVVEVFIGGSSIGMTMADGSGDWSLDHTGTTLSDDTYSITAKATDAAGNTGSESLPFTLVVDSAVPSAPTVATVTNDTGSSSTDGVTSDNTLIISGTAEANSVVEVFIDGSSIGTTMADGSGDWSFDHSGTTLADDTYSITATATDAAGNSSSSSGALTVIVDTSAPGAPTVDSVTDDTGAGGDGVTGDNTLIFTGTAEPNSVVEVFIDGSSIGTTTADGSGDWSFDHTGTTLSDDTYSITARSTDAAGNISATSGALTVVVDTSNPSEPTVVRVTNDTGSSSTDGVTNDNTLVITGTAEANSVVEVFVDGSSIGTTTADGSGDWNFDHTGTTLSDYTYSITARSTDAAGNASSDSLPLTVVVDTSAPGAPTVAAVTDDTGTSSTDDVTNDNQLIFSGTAEANSDVELFIDGSSIGMVTADGLGNWSLDHTGTTLADDTYSVTATATDAAGNTSSVSLTLTVVVDTAAPSAPTVDAVTDDTGSSSTDSVTSDSTLVFSGRAEANSVVEVFIDGSSIGTTTADGSGDWSFDHTGTTLDDDTYSITATSTDAAGNTSSASLALTVVVDSTGPSTPTVDSVTNDTGVSSTDGVTSDNTLVITGTAEANTVVEVFLDGSSIGTTTADGSGDWSFDHTETTLADDTYSVTATATDTAGNTSPESLALTVVVDATAPNTPTVDSVTNDTGVGSDGVTSDNTLIFTGTALANSAVEVFIDGSSIGTTTADGSGNWSFDHTGTTLADDTYSVTATATDTAGNTSAVSDALAVVVDTSAPAGPDLSSPAGPTTVSDVEFSIEGTAEANSLVRVYSDDNNDGMINGADEVVASLLLTGGETEFAINTPLGKLGENDFVVTATDLAGNESAAVDVATITRQNIQVVGTVWLDADGNGVLDEGGRVEGIAVRVLTLDGGEVVQLGPATTTDSNGQYSLTFASQPPEPVVVEFGSMASGVFYRFTQRDVGDDRFDSDAHRLTGRTTPVLLPPTGLIRDAGLIPLTVSIVDAAPVDEGQPGDAVTTEFEVTLNGPAPHPVTVTATAASGTAVLGDDFQQVATFAQTVTFQPGQTSKTVRVPVLGDLQVEDDETFSVTLSMPNGVAIENGGGTATGLIVNDDSATPVVELVPLASVVERNAPDIRAMTFVVRLQGGAVDQDIEVGFETTGVPVPAGFEAAQAGVDYQPRTGTVVIPAGQTSVEIRVAVISDNLPEDDQLFGLQLTGIVSAGTTGAALGSRTSAVGRIIDDDVEVPEVSIGNAELVELNEPFEPAMRFPVTLDGPADQSVFVQFSSVILEGDGTATAFVDYEPRIDGVLEIPAGQISGFIDVRVFGDQDIEPDEVLAVEIVAARLDDGTDILLGETLGVGTIINDDVATPLVGFAGNSQVREGRRNEFRQLEFEITLNGPVSEDVTVIVSTVDPGSAGASTATPAVFDDDGDVSPEGGDFLAFTRRRVVIPKGQTSAILAVDIVGDETPENDEELRVRIVGVDGNATLNQARAQAVGTIRNDDRASVVVTIDPETVVRETDDPKTSVAEFTVRLDAVASETISVGYRTINTSDFAASGLATPGVDFVPVGATPGSEGVVEFAPGETERTIQIVVLGDRLVESPEDFYLELTSVTGENDAMRPVNAVTGVIIDPIATLDPFALQAKATILDNDSGLAVVSIESQASVVEPDAPGVVPVTLTVSLDSALDDDVVVSWRTRTNDQPGHATTDVDFAAVNAGTVRIPAGQTQASIAVSVLGDNLQEGDERFVVMLDSVVSGPAEISTSEGQGVVRIVDNDFDLPVVRISDAEVIEGDPGDDVDLVFTVELAGRVPNRQVSVELATDRLDEEVPGLARTDGDNRDAFATRRILYFDPNVTTQEFRVRVIPDDRFEADELLFVRLFNPDGVGLEDGANQAVGRIINDDFAVPTLTIGSATMLEGDVPGQNVLEFEVTLDADPEQGSIPTVTVDYDTIDVTAVGGDDYQAASGTLTFDEDHRSQTIRVPINGDTMNEGTEEFIVELSNAVNANLHPGAFQGLGVIENDDAPDVQLRIDSVTQREGNDGTTDFVFTVTRVGQPTTPVTIDFATEAGTALAGIDFLAQSGQLTFLPGGAATQEITVDVVADDLPEEEVKSFFVTLDNPVGATIDPEAAQGSGTILDDDERVFREDGDQELLRIARRIQDLIAEIGNDPNNRELLDLITTLSRDVLRRLNLDAGLVFITDPVDFLLTDVESRTVGYTNSSGEVTEVANAYYSGDAAVELVVIPRADPGLYGLQLSGVGSGEYATAATLVTADGFATTQTTSGVLNGEFELALDLRPNPIADLRNGVFAELAGSARDEAAEQNLKNLTNKQLAASEEARQALENLRSEIRDALNSDDQSPLTNGVFGQLLRRVAELGGDLRDSLKEELEELFGGPLTDLDGQVDPDADKDDEDKEPDTLDTFWRSLGRSLLGTPGHLLNLSDFFDLTGSNDDAEGDDGTNENGEQQNDGQNNGAAPNNNGQAQRDGDQQAALIPERYRRLRYWPDGRFAQIDDGKVSPWAQPQQAKSAGKPEVALRQKAAVSQTANQSAAPSDASAESADVSG